MTEAEELCRHLDAEHSVTASPVYPPQVLRSIHEQQHLRRTWPHDHGEDDEPATA